MRAALQLCRAALSVSAPQVPLTMAKSMDQAGTARACKAMIGKYESIPGVRFTPSHPLLPHQCDYPASLKYPDISI